MKYLYMYTYYICRNELQLLVEKMKNERQEDLKKLKNENLGVDNDSNGLGRGSGGTLSHSSSFLKKVFICT
jgi:hypothetical protein